MTTKTTKKQQMYSVKAKVTADISIDISADNLTDALAKAIDMKIENFITINGDLFDGDLEIRGLWKS